MGSVEVQENRRHELEKRWQDFLRYPSERCTIQQWQNTHAHKRTYNNLITPCVPRISFSL